MKLQSSSLRGEAESGEAVALEGERLHLVWSAPKAPGQPVELHGSLEGKPFSLAGKALGSRRRDDGGFDVRVRLINLRREQRQALEALFASESPPPSP